MSVERDVTPAKAWASGQEGAEVHVAHNPAAIPASAGMTRLRRTVLTVGGVAGGLLALDVLGFVATVYFSAELLQAAEAAGVAGLLPR
jgi:hypothetical protein